MNGGVRTIIYPVKDVAKAKKLYGELTGVEPYADEDYYVGFKVGDQEIGLNPHGQAQGITEPVAYWHVDDIESSLQTIVDSGGQIKHEIEDVGGGRLIARVADADGNTIGLLQDTQ